MPSSGRTIIFNTRWMNLYAGPEDDLPRPHFRWLKENDTAIGGERENFRIESGRCRGYVQVASDHINLARLDPAASDDDEIDGVAVVFTATPAAGTTRLVGWYEDATLSRHRRRGSARARPSFFAEAGTDRCYLIPPVERTFDMKKGAKGHQGQNPVCYISQLNPLFDDEICSYLESLKRSGLLPLGSAGATMPSRRPGRKELRNSDPVLRREIEEAAIAAVRNYYESRGRTVQSVEVEDKGWDLETDDGLRIEVKGRGADHLLAELTPNEYRVMKAVETNASLARTYRVAVVTNALEQGGRLHIFAFVDGEWRCKVTGRTLDVEPVIAARLRG